MGTSTYMREHRRGSIGPHNHSASKHVGWRKIDPARALPGEREREENDRMYDLLNDAVERLSRELDIKPDEVRNYDLATGMLFKEGEHSLFLLAKGKSVVSQSNIPATEERIYTILRSAVERARRERSYNITIYHPELKPNP